MPFTLTMPKLSPTMEEGTIVKWHKKEGDAVQPGDLLLEIATDKATVEHFALDEGWLRQILVKDGDEVLVNQPIGIMSVEPGESLEGYLPKEVKLMTEKQVEEEDKSGGGAKEKPVEESPKKKGALLEQPQFSPEEPLEDYEFEFPIEQLNKRILASPLAKKMAKLKGLDLSTVKGTGPNQRIMSTDLEKAQVAGPVSFGRRETPTLFPGSFEERPLSPMRKVIGQRLQESKSFIPHFYVTQIINAEPLVQVREQLISNQIKLTINDFIVRACSLALREHPIINSGFNSVNQTIIHFQTIDIAIAVSVDGGLITPIVRHADYKNLGELSLEIRSLAQKAKEGKLQPKEFKGGSFTISNLGMFGITDFQAIINPPQAAILAVGGIQDVPVIRAGQVVAGKTLNLTLSVDHRVIDGVAAAQFLCSLKKALENPCFLLI